VKDKSLASIVTRISNSSLGDIEDNIIMAISDSDTTPLTRPASFAYASASPTSDLWNRLIFFVRVNSRAAVTTFVFFCFVLFISSDTVHDQSFLRGGNMGSFFGGASYPGSYKASDAIIDDHTFHFAAVTDLDKLSRTSDPNELNFYSILMPGILTRNPSTDEYSIEFGQSTMIFSKLNEGGRGMELSELTLYNDRLLAFDDRTGAVFEVMGDVHKGVTPRLVITEGDGDNAKGMKWEWATVKGKELYIGSFGKEYTRADGTVVNTNNLWIAVVDEQGIVRREDWSKQYDFVKSKFGVSPPGYMIHEAVLWSEHLKKWVFLPRRVSNTAYDDIADERKGSNLIGLVDEHFTTADVHEIKFQQVDKLHGFSTVAFVPGTKDHHALAIRSVEEDCALDDESLCKQRSYFTVFNVLTGDVLMEELLFGDMMKFEGVEFVKL